MKTEIWSFGVPVFAGIAGYFLPYASYNIPPHQFSVSFSDNYSGSAIVFLLLAYSLVFLILRYRKKQLPYLSGVLLGIYLLGAALLRLYHVIVLMTNTGKSGMENSAAITTYPREGLFLVMIAGIWIILSSLKEKKSFFNAR
jgi:hypothetical protein